MDKEAQEKIVKILNEPLKAPWAGNAVDTIQAGIEYQALEILQTLEQLGYRKLPKEEPPLLSDEEIIQALDNLIASSQVIKRPERAVAQAQREADIKWYGDLDEKIIAKD